MIAKVEPLTPRAPCAGRSTTGSAATCEGVGVGSMLVVPFGRAAAAGRGGGPGRGERAAAGAARRAARGARGRCARRRWCGSGSGWRGSTCSTPARGLALVLPPGTGTGAGPAAAPAALAARRAHRGRRARRCAEGRRGWARASGRRSRRWPRGPLGAAALGAPRRLRPRDPAQPGAARAGAGSTRPPEPPRRPRLERGGRARRAPRRAHAGPERGARRRSVARLDARRPRRARCSCTASPAAARPRSTCARWPLALERGRSAIVLVPEIALTPQTAGRFVERFGDSVAVMHSRLAARERYDEWWRMRRGEARVCVGPRSAVFAPFDDLGLIVVDEEHDASYKQEGDPRYDARVVAERRAARGGRRCCWRAAPRRGRRACVRHERLALPERVDGRRLPPVELVGMAGRGRARSTSAPASALDEVRRRGEKAIVLLNRRGWSNFLSCRVCGRVWECPDCDVTLVLHRAADEMACHHCGHRERGAAGVPRLRVGVGGAPRRGHRAARARARGAGARRCRCSGSTPTWPPRRARRRVLRALRRGARRACWSARRWWRRATTSPTSRWAWCSTPTRRCASPTSAPRSARSRSWRSSPAAAAAASAAGA